MKSRVFMSDEGFYVDRKKPMTLGPNKLRIHTFNECDPCDVIDELEAQVNSLTREVVDLKARVVELEAEVKETSTKAVRRAEVVT